MPRPIVNLQPTCLQTPIIPQNQNYPFLIQEARKD